MFAVARRNWFRLRLNKQIQTAATYEKSPSFARTTGFIFINRAIHYQRYRRLNTAGSSIMNGVDHVRPSHLFTELKKCVVFGPGSIQQAHTHDEWVELDQLTAGTDAYARMIEHWCC